MTRVNGLHLLSAGESRAPASPEQRLWQAVLLRHMQDAVCVHAQDASAQRDVTQARAWLDGAGPTFRAICIMAGFEPEAVSAAWRSGKVAERLTDMARFNRDNGKGG